MKCVIKNTKYNNYYQKDMIKGYHFVIDIQDALICKDKREAKKILKKFIQNNFEIVEYKERKK